MEIKGKVIMNLGLQKGTSKAGKEWSKTEIVIETEGQYPKKIKLSNMKNAEGFSLLPVGVLGIFQIELESREYNGRWYTEVNCWKWDLGHTESPEIRVQNSAITQKVTYEDMGMPTKTPDESNKQTDPERSEDDLPF